MSKTHHRLSLSLLLSTHSLTHWHSPANNCFIVLNVIFPVLERSRAEKAENQARISPSLGRRYCAEGRERGRIEERKEKREGGEEKEKRGTREERKEKKKRRRREVSLMWQQSRKVETPHTFGSFICMRDSTTAFSCLRALNLFIGPKICPPISSCRFVVNPYTHPYPKKERN